MNDDTVHVHMKHGAGGRAMRALIESVFLDGVTDPEATAMDDGAAIPWGDRFLVVTTDAHVVKPIFFPGGDIGRLAVSGVVNDLAMMGATEVLALTSSVILEEGFPIELLRRVKASMAATCREASAPILTGDTKVMGKGEVDGLVMSTSGLGVADRVVRDAGLCVGDAIVINGTIGDHGLAIMSARHQLGLQGELRSDVAPLNGLVRAALRAGGDGVHAMKDPTRGGVISALAEMADKARVSLLLDEAALPMSDAARAAADLLGIDPLGVANEGKALIGVAAGALDAVLAALRAHPLGARATCIGRVVDGDPGVVLLDTGFGTRRLFERDGEPLPRIC
ncbi:MAG: hydrogenase expression/formation protein HypE [Deltaproteobacteria bacterium]|nr:hydrogenase expression/formation protein HypE [Deltaproteobacteria bacterium]